MLHVYILYKVCCSPTSTSVAKPGTCDPPIPDLLLDLYHRLDIRMAEEQFVAAALTVTVSYYL